MELRSINQRLEDLEHDNNLLREKLAILETDQSLLSRSFDDISEKIRKLVAKVNEFVGRFSVVQ